MTGSMEAKLLRNVERWNLVLAVALVALSALWRPRLDVVLGVALGSALSCINFTILRRIVERVTVARSKGLLVGVLMVKMVLLLVAVWLVLKFTPINVIAFTIGVSIFLVSFFIATVKLTVAQAAAEKPPAAGEQDNPEHSVN
jgi:hypothetical protein